MSFASKYMIYAVISMAFLVPAEKLLRSFFGFDKAGTLSAAGSFAGGAVFSSILNKINRPKSGGSGGSGGAGNEGTSTIRKPSNLNNFNAQNIVYDMMGSENSRNTNNTSEGNGQGYGQSANGLNRRNSLDDILGGLTPAEQEEKDELENYFNSITNEDAYLNPVEYQMKLERLQELRNKQNLGGIPTSARRTKASTTANTQGIPTSTRRRNASTTANIQGIPTSTRRRNASTNTNTQVNTIRPTDRASTISSLTAPIFNKGDKWRIARGYQKNSKGEWVKGKGVDLGDRIGNAVGAAAYAPYRQIADKARTIPKTVGKLARKAVVGGVVGGTLGVAGVAIGAAAGDPSKAFKYAAAGATAGYYGANHYGDKAAKAAGEVAQSAKTGFWGEDIEKIEQAKFDDKFSKDPKNIDTLTRALGTREKAKKAIKEGHVQAFLNKGVTNVAKIGKALALMEKNELGAKNETDGLAKAVALTVLDKTIDHSIYDRTSIHRATFIEREVEELEEAGLDEKTATEKVEQILKNLEYLNS